MGRDRLQRSEPFVTLQRVPLKLFSKLEPIYQIYIEHLLCIWALWCVADRIPRELNHSGKHQKRIRILEMPYLAKGAFCRAVFITQVCLLPKHEGKWLQVSKTQAGLFPVIRGQLGHKREERILARTIHPIAIHYLSVLSSNGQAQPRLCTKHSWPKILSVLRPSIITDTLDSKSIQL